MLQASWAAGFDGVVLREFVDQVVAGKAAYRQQQEPNEDEADRDRAELEPATPTREPDRKRRDRERDEPHPVGDCAQDPGDASAPSRAGSLR